MTWPEIRVIRARLYEIDLPLATPFAIPGGVMQSRRSLVVELEDTDGVVGQGESAPFETPFYSGETVGSARLMLEYLLSRLKGRSFQGPLELNKLVRQGVRGNEMAVAGAETAGWDLMQRKMSVPVSRLLARRLEELGVNEEARSPVSYVESGVALGIPKGRTVDLLLESVDEAIAAGYRRIKLKVEPGWDVAPVTAVLGRLRESDVNVPVTVDANGSFDPERDAGVLAELDKLGLLFIEQPFRPDLLLPHVKAARCFETPICLDETLTSAALADQLVELNGPNVWNVKVQRVGGLEEACRIYAKGVGAGMHLWTGTMPESGLGAQFALALGSLPGFCYPTDVEPSSRWFAEGSDLVTIEMDSRGRIEVGGMWRQPVLSSRGWLIGVY